jgi:hypothetical protein
LIGINITSRLEIIFMVKCPHPGPIDPEDPKPEEEQKPEGSKPEFKDNSNSDPNDKALNISVSLGPKNFATGKNAFDKIVEIG